jgi:hypothetical protein
MAHEFRIKIDMDTQVQTPGLCPTQQFLTNTFTGFTRKTFNREIQENYIHDSMGIIIPNFSLPLEIALMQTDLADCKRTPGR